MWQPPAMGTAFASDGYVWTEPEEALGMEVKGCVSSSILMYLDDD